MLVKPRRSERSTLTHRKFSDETDKIPPEQEHDHPGGRAAGPDDLADRALRVRASPGASAVYPARQPEQLPARLGPELARHGQQRVDDDRGHLGGTDEHPRAGSVLWWADQEEVCNRHGADVLLRLRGCPGRLGPSGI